MSNIHMLLSPLSVWDCTVPLFYTGTHVLTLHRNIGKSALLDLNWRNPVHALLFLQHQCQLTFCWKLLCCLPGLNASLEQEMKCADFFTMIFIVKWKLVVRLRLRNWFFFSGGGAYPVNPVMKWWPVWNKEGIQV